MNIRITKHFNKFGNKPKLPFFDRNTYIQVPRMLVVTEDGENLGVLEKEEALAQARERGVDLVLINPQGDPPVAKIISWSKFKYEQTKKKKKSQKTNKGGELKEMWFKPFIDTGDLEHKVERIKEFLEKGNKVKVTVRAKGPSPRDKMEEVMRTVLQLLAEEAEPESEKKYEGRNLAIFLKPKR